MTLSNKEVLALLRIGLEDETDLSVSMPTDVDVKGFRNAETQRAGSVNEAREGTNLVGRLKTGPDSCGAQFISGIANTEPRPVSTSLAVAKRVEASKGPERDGYKPLMRNRTARLPFPDRQTASDTFPTLPAFGSRPNSAARDCVGGRDCFNQSGLISFGAVTGMKAADSGIKEAATVADVKELMELRVKVAELCGWQNITDSSGRGYFYGLHPNPEIGRTAVPDYPNDLNACREAWLSLSEYQKQTFELKLIDLLFPDKSHGELPLYIECSSAINASAEQRCCAFVKTMGAASLHGGKTIVLAHLLLLNPLPSPRQREQTK